MPRLHTTRAVLAASLCASVFAAATPARAQQLKQHCQWGAGTLGAKAPTVWPASKNVMMQPVVMDFFSPPKGGSQIAFLSFETSQQQFNDRGGVLRIIDDNCNELARFPDPASCPAPPPSSFPANCPADLFTNPHLAPVSGLAAGNVDWNPDVEIVAVLDEPHPNKDHKQLVAFNLVGGCLKPKWCSPPLQSNDVITAASSPALAQLDPPGSFGGLGDLSEIIIDDKVYTGFGGLRYTGFSTGGNNCGAGSGAVGGIPCPKSRAVLVANLLGKVPILPQLVTGRGLYQSNPLGGSPTTGWTGSLGWSHPTAIVTKSANLYPAVANLDVSGPPEIVVSDWVKSRLLVLSPNKTVLAWVTLPVPVTGVTGCGGPPMIGNADGAAGPEIGVASCNRYTLYKFTMGGLGTPAGSPGTLTQIWSTGVVPGTGISIGDASGSTTSTLAYTPDPVIYYADETHLHVLKGPDGKAAQQPIPNTSCTSIEGPVVAALGGSTQGGVIVVASDYCLQSPRHSGVRIFHDVNLGAARAVWNQHTYHVTNVSNSVGVIPVTEQWSWNPSSPAGNTYRVQQP